MRRLIESHGLNGRIEADSAGTIGYHSGNPADARMKRAAKRRDYDLDSRARQIVVDDFDRFDLIVAMDRDNYEDILSLDRAGRHHDKVRLFSEFLERGDSFGVDVPDPYYGGEQGFEHVLDMIEAGCPRILDHLMGEMD